MKTITTLLLASLLTTSSAIASDTPLRRVDAVLETAAKDGAAGILLVRHRGALTEHPFGSARCDASEPITGHHLFDIGSITKIMTAAATLSLIGDGKLALTTTVGEVFASAPPDRRDISVEQLLTHRSPLPDSIGLDETIVKRPFFLEKLFKAPLEPLPEGKSRYSNSGYILLAAIVEERSGASFENYLSRRILAPALAEKRAGITYSIPASDRKRLACGKLRGMPWGSTADYFTTAGPSWFLIGAGGLHAGARDLEQWFTSLWRGEIVDGRSTAMIRSAVTRRDRSGRPILLASGANLIFSSQYEQWPDDDLTFILLTSNAAWPKEKLLPLFRPMLEEMVRR